MYQDKKVAGLWIDHDKAILIETPDQSNTGDFVQIKKLNPIFMGVLEVVRMQIPIKYPRSYMIFSDKLANN